MIETSLNIGASTPFAAPFAVKRASLMWLYLIRGVLAILWALIFARVHQPLEALAIALLMVYPLIDAVSSVLDYRAPRGRAGQRINAFNAALSTVAAIALGVAGTHGAATTLAVFGAWALIAGAAQFMLGLRRRGPELGRQSPMLIAGGLSCLAGIAYGIQAAGATPSLAVLSIYATGGGTFFMLQAGLLAWHARRPQAGNH